MRLRAILSGVLLVGVVSACSTSTSTANDRVFVGGVEGPSAPTVTAAEPSIEGDVVVWSPPTTQVPVTTVFDVSTWAEKDAVEAPILRQFNEDGSIGLTADEIERGDELIGALRQVKNALPFPAPLKVGIVGGKPNDKDSCIGSGNTYPCAQVQWVLLSQGKPVSAAFTAIVVKDGGKWKISARNTCALMRYFRTPCPITLPPAPSGLQIGAGTATP
jgi:hypothetical protein